MKSGKGATGQGKKASARRLKQPPLVASATGRDAQDVPATRTGGHGRAHPEETKAAVMAALAAGATQSEVAERFRVPARTVSSWSRLVADEIARVSRKKKDVIEELIFEGIVGGLRSLNEQQALLGDREFLSRTDTSCQPVAVAYGILADKLYRLLGAAHFLITGEETVEAP